MIALLKSSKSLAEQQVDFFDHKIPYHRFTSLSLLDSIVKIDIYEQGSYLSDLTGSFSSTSSLNTSIPITYSQPDTSKIKKWKNVTRELAMFTVKRSRDNSLYFLNEHLDKNFVEDENDFYQDDYRHQIKKNKTKKIKLKKLIKSKQLKSINCPQVLLNSNLSKKKNSKFLYIKYNLWHTKLIDEYFNFYVNKLNRAKYIYSTNKIDSKAKANEFLIESKKFFKTLKLVDRLLNNDKNEKIDLPILNRFTIDHNRINEEIEQNYDEMYVEFLISIQHREITPEDYEYLSRLDELIKKKTVNESLLNKLKTEVVEESNGEVCGICMDEYELGQVCRYLPCGHSFHSDCIDNWLKSHSTNCPLDNISIEETYEKNKANEIEIKDLMNVLLLKIEENLETESQCKCVIDSIVNNILLDYL